MKKINIPCLLLLSVFRLFFSDSFAQAREGENDGATASITDTLYNNDYSLSEGKELYGKHCKSCHGKRGKGDGAKAANLNISHGDFTKKEFKEKSMEKIVEEINHGRHEMPSFGKKLSEKETLLIVNYILTLEDEKEKKKQMFTSKKGEENESH